MEMLSYSNSFVAWPFAFRRTGYIICHVLLFAFFQQLSVLSMLLIGHCTMLVVVTKLIMFASLLLVLIRG